MTAFSVAVTLGSSRNMSAPLSSPSVCSRRRCRPRSRPRAPSFSSARKCVSTRRRPITSPPGRRQLHLADARQHRPGEQDARRGCGPRRRRRAGCCPRWRRARAPRWAPSTPPRRRAPPAGSISVCTSLISRDVLEDHLLLGEERRRQHGQGGVLVPGGTDGPLQAVPALDDELGHSGSPTLGRWTRRRAGPPVRGSRRAALTERAHRARVVRGNGPPPRPAGRGGAIASAPRRRRAPAPDDGTANAALAPCLHRFRAGGVRLPRDPIPARREAARAAADRRHQPGREAGRRALRLPGDRHHRRHRASTARGWGGCWPARCPSSPGWPPCSAAPGRATRRCSPSSRTTPRWTRALALLQDVCGSLDEPGTGIAFTVPVTRVVGLKPEMTGGDGGLGPDAAAADRAVRARAVRRGRQRGAHRPRAGGRGGGRRRSRSSRRSSR